MSLFLGPSDRYKDALNTYDPLKGEWLFRILDPWPAEKRDGCLLWSRYLLTFLILVGPEIVFSAIPSATFGGKLLGKDGCLSDFGYYGIRILILSVLFLIPIARRMFGLLINEFVLLRIADKEIKLFSPYTAAKGHFILRLVEWSTRFNGSRLFFWLGVFYAKFYLKWAAAPSAVSSADAARRWFMTHSEPVSLLYFTHVGDFQYNLAGFWGSAIVLPILGYLILLIARLYVVFACLCSHLGHAGKIKITPNHPDKTGGLKPMGQVALFFSLFFFSIGIALIGITLNEIIHIGMSPVEQSGLISIFNFILFLWAIYLIIGTLLFFLPLFPLRKKMQSAKRAYLLEMYRFKAVIEEEHVRDLKENAFKPDFLSGITALDTLIQNASEMAIWPFDRKTLVRYAGLLSAPLTPLLVNRLPSIVVWLKAYLGFLS